MYNITRRALVGSVQAQHKAAQYLISKERCGRKVSLFFPFNSGAEKSAVCKITLM